MSAAVKYEARRRVRSGERGLEENEKTP